MTVTAPADQSKDKKTGEYTTWPDIIKHWPKTTLLIVSNEFCERFSYYGMKSVLFIYLTNILMFTDYAATLSFSFFNIICFTTPILGSIIADGYLGKFWTIFFVSIVYTAGQITLAVSSFGPKGSWLHPWLDIIGMLVIALGTGGIKPCVSSFGADQFPSNQLRMLSLFFSAFYFSINAGAVISSWISPYFRSQTCMGLDACFPFAFGAPAVLMIVATVIFMAGSLWYKKNPPKENIFAEVYRVIKQAISNKMRADVGKDHWVDHYMNTHDCQSDKKCLSAKKELRNPSACHKEFNWTPVSSSVGNFFRINHTFSSWPGYGMLIIRMIYALWFLINVRGLISREQDEERAVFVAHVGAGFLVWLVYLPGLGVVTSFISLLWRFKIILGITTLANFSAIACLLHLFWPTSSYRKFFQDDLNGHRRMGRTDSHELQDYERLLFESSDSEPDFPEIDPSTSLHAI